MCRYKMGGYPVPFGPSVPEFNRRLHGFHRFSHVTCHAIDLPFFCLQTKIPKIGIIGGYLLIRVCRYKMGGSFRADPN